MARQTVYTGKRIQLALETLQQADGSIVEKDVVVHPGAIAVLPILGDGRVCLIRNKRHTAGEELIEVVAGTLEPPELPEACAPRELAEETGYRAKRWTKLAEFYTSPGVLTEKMHLFLAEELTAGPQELAPGEEIKNLVVPWSQARAWALDGTIRDAKTLAAILLYDARRGGA